MNNCTGDDELSIFKVHHKFTKCVKVVLTCLLYINKYKSVFRYMLKLWYTIFDINKGFRQLTNCLYPFCLSTSMTSVIDSLI